MKAFVAAVVVGVAVAFGAALVLDGSFQSDTAQLFTTDGARVGDAPVNPVQY
jgi:hypothetical protein